MTGLLTDLKTGKMKFLPQPMGWKMTGGRRFEILCNQIQFTGKIP
jgi:hypothetical protein